MTQTESSEATEQDVRITPEVRVVYGRLWRYVTPHKLIGLIAILSMATTAVVEGGLVWLLAPLTDETLVAKNLETSRWGAGYFPPQQAAVLSA